MCTTYHVTLPQIAIQISLGELATVPKKAWTNSLDNCVLTLTRWTRDKSVLNLGIVGSI